MSDPAPVLNVRKSPAVPQPAAPPLIPAGQAPKAASRVAVMRARARTTSGKELIFRVVVAVLLIGSLVLVWAAYQKLLVPAQKKTRDLSTSISRLSAEVDQMERNWASGDIDRLTTDFSSARSLLISGQPQLEGWLAELRQQVLPLALDANAKFGNSVLRSTDPQNLALIPATVSVQAQPALNVEGIESPYHRILRFTQNLLTFHTRADLTRLSVTGGLNAPTKAELVLDLWAGEEETQ